MLPFVFTENSRADIIKYALHYEEKQEGLGLRFMDAVNQAAEDISILPTGYASYYKSTRERKTKNFPYKLIYTIEREVIYIHAVFPERGSPKKKYKSLKK